METYYVFTCLFDFFPHVDAHQGTNSKKMRSMVATTCATHLGGDHLTNGTATLTEEWLRSTLTLEANKNL